MLYKRSQCEITIVGGTACEVIKNESTSVSSFNMLENASAVWEFLKGQNLPGVMALDRVCQLRLCSFLPHYAYGYVMNNFSDFCFMSEGNAYRCHSKGYKQMCLTWIIKY